MGASPRSRSAAPSACHRSGHRVLWGNLNRSEARWPLFGSRAAAPGSPPPARPRGQPRAPGTVLTSDRYPRAAPAARAIVVAPLWSRRDERARAARRLPGYNRVTIPPVRACPRSDPRDVRTMSDRPLSHIRRLVALCMLAAAVVTIGLAIAGALTGARSPVPQLASQK